jgi:hypothetical protein
VLNTYKTEYFLLIYLYIIFDFVSIFFYNKKEIDLLKIQLFSFKFIDVKIINNIYILFNDSKDKNKQFEEEYLTCIKQYVPSHLINKVKIIYVTDLIYLDEIYVTDWFTQQFAKIYVSKIINSKYYIMLDSKNIFIKNIDISYFIKDNKLKMYCENHSEGFINYYRNCFNYFNIENISLHNPYKEPWYVQTTTPFIFITEECKNIINFIENKENMSLYNFFLKRKYTEFFLYFAWLCFTGNKEYIFLNEPVNNAIIGPFDPKVHNWNSWEYKINKINLYNFRVLSISSKCLHFIDNDYKDKIENFISNIFKTKLINDTIKNILHN